MTKSILKTVVFGALMGAALFFAPVFIIGMCIFFAIMRMFMFGRMRHQAMYQFAYIDKVRGMNDEEYSQFKNNMFRGHNHCNHNHYHGHCQKPMGEKKVNDSTSSATENKTNN